VSLAREGFCFKMRKIMIKYNILEETLLRTLVTGLEANSQKTNYMVIACERNAGQDHSTETDIKSFESIAKFNNPNNLNKPKWRS
jgi:hypothetical protein